MDIRELEHHAKKHKRWVVQLTARNALECRHNVGTNSEGRNWDDYSYFLDGVRIGPDEADAALASVIATALGLQLTESYA